MSIPKQGVSVIQSSLKVSRDETEQTSVRMLQTDGRVSDAEIGRGVGLYAP